MLGLNKLYEAVSNFKSLTPGAWISDYRLIVIQDPETAILGYCSLDDERLIVYLGLEGLRGYLEMLHAQNDALFKQTYLSLSFSDEIELEASLVHARAGFFPSSVNEGWECDFFIHVLEKLTFIISQLQQNTALQLIGDEVLVCTQSADEQQFLFKAPMRFFLDQLDSEKVLYENELEAYRISRLPIINTTFEVSQFFIPEPIKSKEKEFYPLVTTVFDSGSKQLLFSKVTDSSLSSQLATIHQFAGVILNDLKFRPQYLVTDSKSAVINLKDFCAKTDILLKMVPHLGYNKPPLAPDRLEQAGFEEEIDLMLDTAKAICQKILNSGLSTLNEDAKQQFTSIIELIHIVMLGNFKELPDSWTANNIEIACKDILPSLLSADDQTYVLDILVNYVDIVGIAQELPNYLEIKNRLQALYS